MWNNPVMTTLALPHLQNQLDPLPDWQQPLRESVFMSGLTKPWMLPRRRAGRSVVSLIPNVDVTSVIECFSICEQWLSIQLYVMLRQPSMP
jgi:hypothetical protein